MMRVELSKDEADAVVAMMRTYSSVARMTMAERRVVLSIATRIERTAGGHELLGA